MAYAAHATNATHRPRPLINSTFRACVETQMISARPSSKNPFSGLTNISCKTSSAWSVDGTNVTPEGERIGANPCVTRRRTKFEGNYTARWIYTSRTLTHISLLSDHLLTVVETAQKDPAPMRINFLSKKHRMFDRKAAPDQAVSALC